MGLKPVFFENGTHEQTGYKPVLLKVFFNLRKHSLARRIQIIRSFHFLHLNR